eukprot:1244743-Rhodomonas_salina.1
MSGGALADAGCGERAGDLLDAAVPARKAPQRPALRPLHRRPQPQPGPHSRASSGWNGAAFPAFASIWAAVCVHPPAAPFSWHPP